jgi:ribosomal protein S18 acetylase RimI-like enzyme
MATNIFAVGRIAAEVFYDDALTEFLAPHRAKYYSHYERGFQQRVLKLMFNPRCLCFVACEATHPEKPIASVQIERVGDNEGARKQIARTASVRLMILDWVYWAWCLILLRLTGGNKAGDPEAERLFASWGRNENRKIWEPFPERWHVDSCVVKTKFQGQGIGKKLMGEVIKIATDEGVMIGLEASPHGEWLYRSVGFKLLARFEQVIGSDIVNHGNSGGFMMWTPQAINEEKKKL